MAMTWRAERSGNWLFHCHISEHISPERRLSDSPVLPHDHHGGHDATAGMAGMVLGVTIVDPPGMSASLHERSEMTARKMTLIMQTEPGRYGAEPAYGFALALGDDAPPAGTVSVPGPTLTLRRDEPVEITLVNHLPEATSIHWHGMELQSFYDGVHGWSGAGSQVTPLIEPGQSFSVRFTPPRAGTFIYHTHLHDDRQLTSGMCGAMLVLEPGETFDPSLDHVVVIGRGARGRPPQRCSTGIASHDSHGKPARAIGSDSSTSRPATSLLRRSGRRMVRSCGHRSRRMELRFRLAQDRPNQPCRRLR